MLEKFKFKFPELYATLKQQWLVILLVGIAVIINLFTLVKHNPVTKTPTPTVITKVDTVFKDKEVIKYINSNENVKKLEKDILNLHKDIEVRDLKLAELKSLLKHQENAKKQIKYFGRNVSVDSVLKRIGSITNKYPIQTGVSNR